MSVEGKHREREREREVPDGKGKLSSKGGE
jgi:hypothetical protein